jgi:hypothetical protein
MKNSKRAIPALGPKRLSEQPRPSLTLRPIDFESEIVSQFILTGFKTHLVAGPGNNSSDRFDKWRPLRRIAPGSAYPGRVNPDRYRLL